MNILIRNAQIKDFEAITKLSDQLGYKNLNTDIQNRLEKIIQNKDNCIYVAIKNDEIVGWIHGFYSLRVESESFVEIGGIIVDENFRKNGIGKKLVDKVTEWSVFKSCKKLRVRCNVIRIESHLFYETAGFKINKEQKIFDKYLK